METERIRKAQERDNLRNIIAQWNANRLDLFELSEPNEDLEFHGVMRFYFQDAGQKVATKCLRVSSTAASQLVIKTLIEKFRPDMRMLSIPEYALYEIHENGEERKLADDEKPLLVQLNWHRDDREGRFLLRRMDEKTYVMPHHFEDDSNFKRKLSKREKKEKKKKEKLQRLKNNEDKEQEDGIAERLYTELPETSFTRSISNPEAVMRRRRQQKLEKKLQQFRSRDGGPDTGGTLKIYGESLCKDVPYKTLLLSVRDTAAQVVREMLNKYGLDKEDPSNYCLVQSFTMGDGESKEYPGANPGKECFLDDDECPLAIPMNYPPTKGSVTFHIRRRPADYQPRKRKKKPKSRGDVDYRYKGMEGMEKLPYFLELNPDGSEISAGNPRIHCLHLNVTEVGSERSMSSRGQYLQLFGPNVHPRHCVIAHTEGIVTVTPCSRDAETYVNNQRIFETTILQHGMAVRFGKIHNFRFIDPIQEERRHRHDSVPSQNTDYYDRHSTKDDSSLHPSVLENSYDGDNIDTVSTSSQKEDRKVDKIKDVRSPTYERYDQRRGHDPILPAVLEFREDGEDVFLRAVISTVDPNMVQFKLAPTYTLYMAARYRASTHYRPDINPNERALRLTNLQNKVAAMMQHVIQEKYGEAVTLAFWMANASELLHFLKQDRHVSAYSLDAQDILAESVQIAFRNLVQCLQTDFHAIMPAFLDERDDAGEDDGATAGILSVLSSAMSLLRRCRVNAALTIQLFSQLFHFINMWLFNKLVSDTRPNYCTRLWGVRLKLRLACIEFWAEKQGLELAADCHLSRIAQAAHLLQSPKSSPDDISTISSTCFKLNSLQLRTLLEKYQPVPDEPRIPQELIENVVKVAENTADELARTDGREVKLEEDPDLQLPFLLPEDGYSCDIVRGVPAGLQEFLLPLQQANLCRLTVQPTSSGYWTIYMSDQDINRNTMRSSGSLGQHSAINDLSQIGKEPEIMTIRLQKSNSGMGLSIVAAKGVGQDKLGIYIKSVVKGGAADADGRLQAGDQLLKVDGQSLVGITQERAAEYMTRTGPTVTLEVAKQGAIYHGLATLLNQPSPVMQRGLGNPSARRSERDLPSRIARDQVAELDPRYLPRIQGSKSVPSLNSDNQMPEPTRMNSGGNLKAPQEIFNPGYSRTSSTASIVKSTEQASPKEKTRYAGNEGFAPDSQRSRPHLNAESEERFYQNISMYQQQSPYGKINENYVEYPLQHTPTSPKSPRPYEDRTPADVQQPIKNFQQAQPQHPVKQHPPNVYQQPPFSSPKLPYHPQYDDRFNRNHRGSQSSLHHPETGSAIAVKERPLSALVSQRERDHFLGTNAPGMIGGADERQIHYHPHQEQLPKPNDPRNYEIRPSEVKGVPQNARYPDGYIDENHQSQFHAGSEGRINALSRGKGPGGFNTMDPRRSDRNFLRQEAKMDEMREEVKRREERSQRERELQAKGVGNQIGTYSQRPMYAVGKPTHNSNLQVSQNQLDSSQYLTVPHPSYSNQNYAQKPPPPPAPKPKGQYVQGPEKPQRQYMYDMASNGHSSNNEIPPERPPLPDEAHLYRDSPPPPPPPPASTHPLMQIRAGPQNGISQSHRYGNSSYPEHLQKQYGPYSPTGQEKQFHNRSQAHSRVVCFDPRIQDQTSKNLANSVETVSAKSPSPWDREEREKERKKRLAEAHRLRDQEIQELEALQYRTPKQEERLRTLRLEQEFQRRAEEHKGNDDDEDNEDDDDIIERKGLLRMMQEDLERNRLRRMEHENDQQQSYEPKHELQKENTKTNDLPSSTHNTEEWLKRQQDIKNQRREQREEERLRQQKLEEVQKKREQERQAMRELQAAKEAEERLLREAQRRQEEDMKMHRLLQQQQQQQPPPPPSHHHQQQYQQHAQQQYQQHPQQNHHSQHYLQTNDFVPPHHPPPPPPPTSSSSNSYPPHYMQNSYHSTGTGSMSAANGAGQRLDNLLSITSNQVQQNKPQLPEGTQNNNYGIIHNVERKVPTENDHTQTNSFPHSALTLSRNESAPPKRVSFHDSKLESTIPYNDGGTKEKLNNNYVSEANSAPTSPYSEEGSFSLSPLSSQVNSFATGNSPGVIGTQEIYRDPRKKIEAQRLSQNNKVPGPEKLSFKEKMKMFALETGDPDSPRDKVKISRAQREIETNLNGT